MAFGSEIQNARAFIIWDAQTDLLVVIQISLKICICRDEHKSIYKILTYLTVIHSFYLILLNTELVNSQKVIVYIVF